MGSSSSVLVAGPAPPSLGAPSIAWALFVRFLARLGRATPVAVIVSAVTPSVAATVSPFRRFGICNNNVHTDKYHNKNPLL